MNERLLLMRIPILHTINCGYPETADVANVHCGHWHFRQQTIGRYLTHRSSCRVPRCPVPVVQSATQGSLDKAIFDHDPNFGVLIPVFVD